VDIELDIVKKGDVEGFSYLNLFMQLMSQGMNVVDELLSSCSSFARSIVLWDGTVIVVRWIVRVGVVVGGCTILFRLLHC